MNNPELIVCYVLMRTDLASLNPGKAMAQSHHNYGALKRVVRDSGSAELKKQYLAWQKTTEQDYGTVIVLGGTERGIDDALAYARRIKANVACSWVWDFSYPILDGDVVHALRLHTNAFVFGTKLDCHDIIKSFELHE